MGEVLVGGDKMERSGLNDPHRHSGVALVAFSLKSRHWRDFASGRLEVPLEGGGTAP